MKNRNRDSKIIRKSTGLLAVATIFFNFIALVLYPYAVKVENQTKITTLVFFVSTIVVTLCTVICFRKLARDAYH